MKNAVLSILVITLMFLGLSCEKSITETNVSDEGQLKSENIIRDVAEYYAPLIIQDVDITDGWCQGFSRTGSADWITNVDYDGDWKAYNNWENLVSARAEGNIKGNIYYNFASTSTHWFILYSVYHPRDWTDFWCSFDSHENDMEGILIVASRDADGQSFGNIEYASTIFHSSKYNYESQDLIFEDGRPVFFIEAKGHGIRKYNGSDDKDGSYIEYNYTGLAEQPSEYASDLPQNVSYDLMSLNDELYWQKDNPDLFVVNAFRGDNYRDNAANAPWGWGDFCTDPANYIKSAFNLSNFSTTYDTIEIQ